ncbi:MAG TPA: acyl-CoA dehydrogenase family protein [Gaiellaceae bacterium]|nr:acyl-CoA dehydrogenase family protein [Gaiellaceae bacterium]
MRRPRRDHPGDDVPRAAAAAGGHARAARPLPPAPRFDGRGARRHRLHRAARRKRPGGDADDGAPRLGSYAKAYAADVAMRVTTDAVQVLGGAGVMRDDLVEKWFRDAKVFQIVEGTSEIQREIAARRIAGLANQSPG